MAQDDLDLVLFLGDYIYEYPTGEGDLAAGITAEPQTEADYRLLYGAYKRDPLLQAAHASAPWVVTWDDHEVENNYADEIPEQEADAATFAARRRAAYQVFWENMPLRLDPPDDDGLALYRTVEYGSLATFFVLDGRQYRTDQVCGDQSPTNPAECPELGDDAGTMLGTEQEDWLTEGLGQTEATWKVLAQQTVMKSLVLGDLVLNVDQWDGYPAARTRVTDAFAAAAGEVVVLTGDVHSTWVSDLTSDFDDPGAPRVGTEFVTPGISSHGGELEVITDVVQDNSPHIRYVEAGHRGWLRHEITPEAWMAEIRHVEDPSDAASPVPTVSTWVLEPGQAIQEA
jgi:alkaline phosphatase D